MDFTALVTGSAQAGHSSPVCKPGIGLVAGAGASPTCDAPGGEGADFASLVELALGQLGKEAGEGSATGTAGISTRPTDDDTDAAPVEGAPSPLDVPVDAATLAVLIALATPPVAVAVPPPDAAPQADAAGQAGVDLAALDGAPAGTSITAAEMALSGAPQRPVGAPDARNDFQNNLATAGTTAAPVTAPTSAAPSAAAPAPAAAVPTSAVPTPAVPTSAVSALAVPAAVPAPAAPVGTAPEAQVPGIAEAATAPAPTADAASAAPAAPSAAAAQTTARPSQHPLRQALAAMAAEATPSASTPVAQPTSAPTAPVTASYVAAQAAQVPAEVATPTHEPRTTAAAPAEAPGFAAVAASGVGADTGSTGDPSSGGAQDGSAASTFRGAEARLDASVPAAGQPTGAGISPEALASSLTATAGFGAASTGDPVLRAIDLPAAARFEQALSSLDPDVRNLQAMVRTVRLFTAGSGASEARLTLEPEHLGPVALTVRVEQGSVSAHFRAETPAAHRWIETHQQELRSGLREQGLEVKEVVVTTDPDGRRERQQHEAPVKPRARTKPAADAPRFEVLA